MTNPYDPDPLNPKDRGYDWDATIQGEFRWAQDEPLTVGRGFAVWVIGSALAVLVGVVIAALLWTGTVRAAETEHDGIEVAHAPPMAAVSTVTGTATWYCSTSSTCTKGYPASGMFAAAGSELRAWRGELVRVRSGSRSVVVRLIDVCGCPGARVIDLYRAAFARLASPSRGVIRVEVSWGGGPASTLPPTSTR